MLWVNAYSQFCITVGCIGGGGGISWMFVQQNPNTANYFKVHVLEASGGRLESVLRRLGTCWGRLGASWGRLEVSWGRL